MKRALGIAAVIVLPLAYACGDDDAAKPEPILDAGLDGPARDGASADGRTGTTLPDGGSTSLFTCPPNDPFRTVTRLFEDDGVMRSAPTLTNDEKELVFVSGEDLVRSVRTSDVWPVPAAPMSISVAGEPELDPSFASEGLYFVRSLRVLFTTGEPAAPADVKPAEYSFTKPTSPAATKDALYFSDPRVLRAPRAGSGFARPVPVLAGGQEIATDKLTVNAEETVMYFASPAGNVLQVFMTQRATAAEAWPAAVQVTGILLEGDQRPGWASPDQCRLYLTVTSPDNVNALFVASRK